MTFQSWPSIDSTLPFLMSFVVAMRVSFPFVGCQKSSVVRVGTDREV